MNGKFLSPIPRGNRRSFDNSVFVSDDEKITQSPQSVIGNLFKFIQNYLSSKIFKFLHFLNYY